METSKCQVCGSPVEKGTKATICPACETPAHPECWEYNGGCTTYACKESPALKNAKPRAAPVYVERTQRRERRASQTYETPMGIVSSIVQFGTRMVGFVIGLFIFFAFLAGFIEGLTHGPRHSRHRAPPSRAMKIGSGDKTAQLSELFAMRRTRLAAREDIVAAGSQAIWHSDPEIRHAAADAIVAVDGHETLRQEYLCDLLGHPDTYLNKLARENIPDLGRPSKHATMTLRSVAAKSDEKGEAARNILARFKLN